MKKLILAAIGAGAVCFADPALSQASQSNSFTREGLTVEFDATAPLNPDGKMYGGDIVEVTLKITDANSGGTGHRAVSGGMDRTRLWKARRSASQSADRKPAPILAAILAFDR